jgi:phospholipid/cholesterol/gamma-HCH transport system ATP-binding protein
MAETESAAAEPHSTVLRVEPVVRIEGLKKAFDGKPVLRGVDLDIPRGKTVVVLGLSGCGKSTLLKHVIGLLRPDEGRIVVEGRDIAGASEDEFEEIRWRFGMVFQNAALLQSLTVGENVALPLVERRELPPDEIERLVSEKLALVGLAGAEDKMPAELSGGMRKRAGLARAIVHGPDILLYDEPTTGLDPIICRHVDDLIISMREKLGVSSLVISHDIEGARRVGDIVALLHEGAVVEKGPPEEFFGTENPVVRQFLAGESEGPIKVM